MLRPSLFTRRLGSRLPGACEVVAALAVSAGVTAAVVAGSRLWRGAPYSEGYSLHAVTNAAVIVCLAALVATTVAIRRRLRPRLVAAAGYVLTAALPTLAFGLPLARTPLYYGGLHLDQQFRTQYLMRLTESPALSDMNYAGLPPYYPAGWFWLGGRGASILGIPAWQFMKPWCLLTLAAAATLALALWRRLTPAAALPVTTASVLAVLFTSHQEPYSGALAILAPPVTVIAWGALRRAAPRLPAGPLALVAVALGLTAATYTLYAAVAVAVLAVLAVTAWRAGVPATTVAARTGTVAAGGAVIALVVWLPYLISWVRDPHSTAGAAQEYLPTAGAAAWLSQFEPTPLGVTTAIGSLWILWRLRRHRVAQGFAALAAVGYAWTFASLVAAAFGTTLLGFRVLPLLYSTLAAAAVFAAADLIRWVRRHAVDPVTLRRTAIGVALAVLVALAQQATWQLRSDGALAYTDTDCAGHRADGRPAGAQAALPAVDATITRLTGRPRRDTVVLPTDFTLLACHGYRGFTSYIAQYANPLADEAQRKALVLTWARARTARQLTAELDASPYRPPSVFVFQRTAAGLLLRVTRDTFPADPNTAWTSVTFSRTAFTAPDFVLRDVGPYTVAYRPHAAADAA
ncbi:arabinofuranosyltransferase [Tsukamurella soli]|uniref:Galactan 5-O-arabinofuranosyltransferase n=1 Tax=Tsukamurella soli TaxID=644556 RepID=A0ABP8JPW6_9ACTN